MTLTELMEDQKFYEMIYEGRIEDGAVPLGQSIGAINSIETVKDIIENIVSEAEIHLKKAYSYIK
jgi:NAD(P)H-dependent flavin oxidoreductase YrpB (nitropropane dioxygenase family)